MNETPPNVPRALQDHCVLGIHGGGDGVKDWVYLQRNTPERVSLTAARFPGTMKHEGRIINALLHFNHVPLGERSFHINRLLTPFRETRTWGFIHGSMHKEGDTPLLAQTSWTKLWLYGSGLTHKRTCMTSTCPSLPTMMILSLLITSCSTSLRLKSLICTRGQMCGGKRLRRQEKAFWVGTVSKPINLILERTSHSQ